MKPATLAAAEAHAVAEYPRESCGLIVVIGRKEQYVPCKNTAENPNEHFRMDPAEYAAAEDMGQITMIVHSHPDGNCHPSEADRVQVENTGLPWLIMAVHTDPAYPERVPEVVSNEVVEPSGYELPLEGREFSFGVNDCYTLVQDFYQRVLGITLPYFARTDKFWERGENLYMENFESAGFEVIDTPTEPGDLILMSIRSPIVNHAAIWLGEMDHILHHPYEHLSEKTVYGGYWQENTRVFIRKVR